MPLLVFVWYKASIQFRANEQLSLFTILFQVPSNTAPLQVTIMKYKVQNQKFLDKNWLPCYIPAWLYRQFHHSPKKIYLYSLTLRSAE